MDSLTPHLFEPLEGEGSAAVTDVIDAVDEPIIVERPLSEARDSHGSDFGTVHTQPEMMTRSLFVEVNGNAAAVSAGLHDSLQNLGVSGLRDASVTVAIGPSLGVSIQSTNYYAVQRVIHHVQQYLGEQLATMQYLDPSVDAEPRADHVAA